jgi:hypothetical protein
MNGQQSPAFSIAPIMKMYVDSVEAWKQNYEALAAGAKEYQAQHTAHSASGTQPAYDAAAASWQKSGGDFFKRFVEQQIELCHFFAARWENYLKLPEQLAHCHTPAEMAQLQAAFLGRFASDYMQEANKLCQPFGEFMSRWAAARQVNGFGSG